LKQEEENMGNWRRILYSCYRAM